jgi:hypothetical protein
MPDVSADPAPGPPLRIALLDGDNRPQYYQTLRSVPGLLLHSIPFRTDHESFAPDLALISDEMEPEIHPALLGLHTRGIPVLHLADGIVEWRNTWTNPRSNTPAGRPLFHPVIATRIACLGLWQALLLESLGNPPHRCEITGSPRLDYLDDIVRRPTRSVLVATAKTPGFTSEELQFAAAAIQAIKTTLTRHPDHAPVWRISPELGDVIGITPSDAVAAHPPLADSLAGVAAVVTTPSTLALEAMHLGIPTLVVDFTNSPCYLLSAWRATCPDTLAREMETLLRPESLDHQRRLAHQAFLSRLQLEPGSATERVGRLIKLMAANPGSNMNFLPRRSAYPEGEHEFNASSLYPMIAGFSRGEIRDLQARILHLQAATKELAQLRLELDGYRRRRLVRFSDWARRFLR